MEKTTPAPGTQATIIALTPGLLSIMVAHNVIYPVRSIFFIAMIIYNTVYNAT